MNKQYIAAKLPLEYRALYEMSQSKKLDYRLRYLLRGKVRDIRSLSKSHSEDPLKYKLSQWGNEGSWSKDMIHRMSREIYDDNSVEAIPIGEALSVEIECVFPCDSDLTLFIRKMKNQGLRKSVCVKHDGSICTGDDSCGGDCDEGDCQCGGEVPREIVVTFSEKKPEVLKLVCQALSDCGAFVNKSCGLHVHFDMRNHEARAVGVYARRLGTIVPHLKKMLPKSRRNNQYCVNDFNTVKSTARYAFINASAFRKHKTIEVRGHSGTVDYTKIFNWIRLMRLVMNHKKVIKEAHFFQVLAELECPNDLYDYCKERYMTFKGFELETDVPLASSFELNNETVTSEESEVA